MDIDNRTKKICRIVHEVINPSYLVGGCVRDLILKRPFNDYDFCTPLLPDDIEAHIKESGRKSLNIGKRFGTLGMKYQDDPKTKSEVLEIASFRKEFYKKGNRKPKVEFVGNITADLSRRDFTINAMCLRTDNFHLIDPFGGQDDIKSKIIRSTGNATERFKEDPLRMLRACRFAGQLGFKIEEQTFKKMKEYSHRILDVSKERWTAELDKLLIGKYADNGLDYLWKSGLMIFIIPEVGLQYKFFQNNPNHKLTLDNHTSKMIMGLPEDINLRLAGLFHDSGKVYLEILKKTGYSGYYKHELLSAEFVERSALYLKWSNDRLNIVKSLVLNHMNLDSPLKDADIKAKE